MQVVTLEGDGELQSDVFELTGAPAKLTFAVERDDGCDVPAVFVLRQGEMLSRGSGSEPVVGFLGDASAPHLGAKDEADLARSAGRYYVHVVARDGTRWSVTIEESPSERVPMAGRAASPTEVSAHVQVRGRSDSDIPPNRALSEPASGEHFASLNESPAGY